MQQVPQSPEFSARGIRSKNALFADGPSGLRRNSAQREAQEVRA
jgi:hypothetical protein